MEYHRTKDILHVMKLLGHRCACEEEDEYISKVAKASDEARKLVESGFEYVCEIEGTKLFRKRKYQSVDSLC